MLKAMSVAATHTATNTFLLFTTDTPAIAPNKILGSNGWSCFISSYHPHPALPLQGRVWEGVKKGNSYTIKVM
jgi:hypothetical protein